MDDTICRALISALQEAVGDAVVRGDRIPETSRCDWSGYSPCTPLALVRPSTVAEVAKTLSLCHEYGCPIVPQGGMTGLAGGAVPDAHAIALSLDRLVGKTQVDRAAGTLTVWAGTTLEGVQQAASEAGFRYPVDFPARGSCQIGGTIATNAGGQGVIRHGMTRQQVLGLEVVLADGTVLDLMNAMKKNNAGYDLKQCFIGSEGTLGIITRAVLQLTPSLGETHIILCALKDYPSAVALLHRLRSPGLSLEAFEVMWGDFYTTSCNWLESPPPLPTNHPIYCLCEIEATQEHALSVIETAMRSEEVVDAVCAESLAQAKALWAIREATSEFSTRMQPISFDVSLPIGSIGDYVQQAKNAILARWPECHVVNFGHIGDGNLHLTVDEKSLTPDNGARREAIEQLVYELVERWGGSISAEHGIGRVKRDFLHHSVTPEAIMAMSTLKKAFDPANILNRAKVLPHNVDRE